MVAARSSPPPAVADADPRERLALVTSVPFFLVHVVAVVGAVLVGVTWKAIALTVVLYVVRMFAVTAGYHRYFAHRTYKTSRPFQLLLALLAMSSVQKGVLWWASHHRDHHKFSDKPEDVHSLKLRGFYWSHVGWILSRKYDRTDLSKIRDFAKYPELVWLDRWPLLVPVVLAVTLLAAFGWTGLVWGFFVSTVLVWHGTFVINSLAHWMGRRRYATTDESKNSLILALLTLGEGWHNNHHYYPRATNQGFYWWEIDVTYYVLRLLSAVGLVWDLHTPPKHVRDRRMPLGARLGRRDRETPALVPSPLQVAPPLALLDAE